MHWLADTAVILKHIYVIIVKRNKNKLQSASTAVDLYFFLFPALFFLLSLKCYFLVICNDAYPYILFGED